jgi:hypothetical protein
MTGLEYAILGLRHALDAPRRPGPWRGLVRQRMAGVRDALTSEDARDGDAWLAAREDGLLRERDVLLRRLTDLGRLVLDAPDTTLVHRDLQRLLVDLERHCRRLNDLVYDSVSLEIGGSE